MNTILIKCFFLDSL